VIVLRDTPAARRFLDILYEVALKNQARKAEEAARAQDDAAAD